MKKLLAILLAATMFVTVFVTSASAADTVVGAGGGAETFPSTTTDGQDLNVKVTEVTHKYAVDVTYNLDELTFGVMWDVDEMKYKITNGAFSDTTRTITVSNRSDLSVYAYATVADKDAADGVSLVADAKDADSRLTVGKASAGTSVANGTAEEGNITISITSADWTTAATYYADKVTNSNTTFQLATVTVTITKD